MKWFFRILVSLALMTPIVALSQSYPNRPVRLIVPFVPGGGTDLVARLLAPKLSEGLGQPVVVENRAGANGAIGADVVAKSAPDGYTLCICAAGTMVIGPHLTRQFFDSIKDFAPVSLVASSPFVVTVHPSVHAHSIRELIQLAKTDPGKINFGSSGVGGAPHLATELFKSMAGVDMVHVSYKGVAEAMTDLLGGRIQLMFVDVSVVAPYISSGQLRALAISGSNRSSVLPDLPTVEEAGVPGYSAGTWYGVFAPAGTSVQILARISAEIHKALAVPEVRSALIAQGLVPTSNSPEQFAEFVRNEDAKWGTVIRAANIKLE